MPPPQPRRLIGKSSDLSGRQRVYETPDAIEVDEVEGYIGSRRRVFFDEVVLVTRHQFVGWATVAALAIAASFLGFCALVAALGGAVRGALVFFALTGLPLLGALALRLLLKVDAITVYGRRSRAQIRFWLRKGRAREVFRRVCARVRQAQEGGTA